MSEGGSNFDATPGATTVKLNGVTAVSTVSGGTALNFTVPTAVSSGRITATTATGTGTSATDFIVPPAGVAATDIVASVRVTPGGASANMAVPTAGKNGLVLFDAQPGVYYSVQFSSVATSPSTAAVAYQVIKPDNTVLQTGYITSVAYRPTIHLPPLAPAGTYSVLVSPGAATLNTNVRVEINPVTSVDGSAVTSTLDFANQSARVLFTATAGQHVGVGISNTAFTPAAGSPSLSVRVLQPDGTQIGTASTSCFVTSSNTQGNCDSEFLALVSGTYSLFADNPSTAFTNAAFQFTSEVTGALSADVSQPVTLTRVGQDARYSFNVNAGDSLAIDLSNASLLPQTQSVRVDVLKPDGTTVLKSCFATPPTGLYCDLNTVSTAGTYLAYVDPSLGAYGTFNITLKQGPMLATTDPPTAFATSGAAESARFRFAGTASQNLSVGVTGLSYAGSSSSYTYLTVYAPNGAQAGSTSCAPTFASGSCRAVLANLPQTGTYSVVLQPPPGIHISGTVDLSGDLTGTLTPSVTQSLNASRAGQVARYTFAGTAGDSTSVKVVGLTTVPAGESVSVVINRPDGAFLTSMTVGGATSAGLVNFASLPLTGNYSIVVDPTNGPSWQAGLLLDPGAPITVDGPTASPATTNAGESLRYTVALTAGQRVELGMAGLAYGAPNSGTTYSTLYGPNGASLAQMTCGTTGGCGAVLTSAPSTGTYSLIMAPPSASTIAGGTLALSTALPGTFVTGDPPQTIALSRPGQSARYTFSGTSGQLLRLNWSSVSISGTNNYAAITVLKPDGTSLNATSFLNGANSGMDLTALPATGTYTVTLAPNNPSVTISASLSLTTR